MPLFDRLRRSLANRISPDEAPGSRRDFFRQSAGLGAAAIGLNALIPDEVAWAGVEERAARFGITPGTLVDAQGRPMQAAPGSSQPYLGQLMIFGGNFAVRSWAQCDGQLLPISSNSALFSILGTTYGGDGRTTFALPDLRSRFPLHYGQGAGLSRSVLGQRGGTEREVLTISQIPSHSHTGTLRGSMAPGTTENPTGALPAVPASSIPQYGTASPAAMAANAVTIANNGGSQAHNNMSPFLALNFQIALQGLFPSRS
ncbi:MAG: tail fiber protein [Bacteroidota bacterium]